jgi:Transposase DDE domain
MVSRVEGKKIETMFGEAKQTLSLVRLRLRGLSSARDEFLLTAAGHATRPLPHSMTA